MKKKVACLIYGNYPHYLDHLAPLSYFFKIPLITNNDEIAKTAKKYYPKINVNYIDNLNIHFYVVKNFDNIISCITQKLFDLNFKFHQDLLNKKTKIIWCPHGSSDKGKTCPFFESLINEKLVLVYGKKMIDILKEKKIYNSIESLFEIGNYRLKYYQKFKSLFDKIAKEEIKKKLPPNKITIMYAPTWKDTENSSSFETYLETLLKTLPTKYNLIVKLHPNLFEKFDVQIEILKGKYEKNNILFLDNFSLIYPLLNFVNIYLGDFSSIGYDFLYFQKPMFFLQPANLDLQSDINTCGHVICNNYIFKTIEENMKNKKFKEKIKKLYKYTFKQKVNMEDLKKIIFNF